MIQYPEIDPIAINLGFLKIHWYGLTYFFAFIAALYLGKFRAKTNNYWSIKQVDDLVFYCAVGVIIGGRLGYGLFYNFNQIISNPLWIFQIWQGGMSFHGGLLGVLISCQIWGKQNNKSFFEITDFVAPLIPLGLGFGRIGNFINAELLGRVTDIPWAMVFPTDALQLPRHPSQLYQALIEGPIFFIILWLYSSKPRKLKAVSGCFLVFYGIARFITEFFREPDEHIGFLLNNSFTMGQILSIPMILFGLFLIYYRNNNIVNKSDITS